VLNSPRWLLLRCACVCVCRAVAHCSRVRAACADAWVLNTDADQVNQPAFLCWLAFIHRAFLRLFQDKPALVPTPPLTFRRIPHRSLVPLGGRGGAVAALVAASGHGPAAVVVMGGGVASSGRMIGDLTLQYSAIVFAALELQCHAAAPRRIFPAFNSPHFSRL
jgi:hypothetical protein